MVVLYGCLPAVVKCFSDYCIARSTLSHPGSTFSHPGSIVSMVGAVVFLSNLRSSPPSSVWTTMAHLYWSQGGRLPKDVCHRVSARLPYPYLTVLRLCCEELPVPRCADPRFTILGRRPRLPVWLSSQVQLVASLCSTMAAAIARCCGLCHRLFLVASACAFASRHRCSEGVPVLVVVSRKMLALRMRSLWWPWFACYHCVMLGLREV
jgi:hypothetical protein